MHISGGSLTKARKWKIRYARPTLTIAKVLCHYSKSVWGNLRLREATHLTVRKLTRSPQTWTSKCRAYRIRNQTLTKVLNKLHTRITRSLENINGFFTNLTDSKQWTLVLRQAISMARLSFLFKETSQANLIAWMLKADFSASLSHAKLSAGKLSEWWHKVGTACSCMSDGLLPPFVLPVSLSP